MELDKKLKIADVLDSVNAAELLKEDDLDRIGRKVVDEYDTDEQSRSEWKDKTQEALEVALQVAKQKTFPWPGASNIKWPGLTIAALQFNARAYPALVPGADVVKCRVVGADPDGSKARKALRISRHMSYQILEKDDNWSDEQDRLLIMLPIVGTMFKKTYYNPIKETCVSEMVTPLDLVVPYFAKSLETAQRITHKLYMYDNDIQERVLAGLYLDQELPPSNYQPSPEELAIMASKGLTPPLNDESRPREILEQHRYLDLDQDGYKEPYIVTVDKDTKKVLRLVPAFSQESIKTDKDEEIVELAQAGMQMAQAEQERGMVQSAVNLMSQVEDDIEKLKKEATIIRIERDQYFTKYGFIPAVDGGFYDIGFGQLERPVIESINTLVNQLIDSGTLQTSSSGWVARSARMKKGDMRFKPFEWKQIDVVGGNARDAIVPLPIQNPSPVLFELLSLLINYSERLFAVSDLMTGEVPGQNTPASTTLAALEQGLKVYSGVFKRLYNAERREFKKIFNLNKKYLDEEEYFTIVGTNEQEVAYLEDYKDAAADIVPAADPNITSDTMKQQRAEWLAQRAMTVPGYNTTAIEKRVLEAYQIDGIDEIFPTDEQGQIVIQPPPNPEVEQAKAEEERRGAESKAKIDKMYAELEISVAKLDSEIAKMEAEVMLLTARAAREAEGIELDAVNAQLEQMKEARERLKVILDATREDKKDANKQGTTKQ